MNSSGASYKMNEVSELEYILIQLRSVATETVTGSRGDAVPIEYWHVPLASVPLLGQLAEERGHASAYAEIIMRAFDSRAKTAQTRLADNGQRVAIADPDERREAFDAWIGDLFVERTSAPARMKASMNTARELTAQLVEAQAIGALDDVQRIMLELSAVMAID